SLIPIDMAMEHLCGQVHAGPAFLRKIGEHGEARAIAYHDRVTSLTGLLVPEHRRWYTPSVSSATPSPVQDSTFFLAAIPMARRAAGSLTSPLRACAISWTSQGCSSNRPSIPCSIRSAAPAERLVTTGNPAAMASVMTSPKAS